MLDYYNDRDKFCCAWLASLMVAGCVPFGTIDDRPIQAVNSGLASYRQVHLFAGIGGWSRALHLAGWPVDWPVWTGSCPCQPFSVAGKGKGTSDERHLWPEMLRLIAKYRPATIFGEQVASRLGREWLAGVRADLEALGYAVGAADLCAAGKAAPHIRQRLFWVAHTHLARYERQRDAGIIRESGEAAQGRLQEREWRGEAIGNSGATGRGQPGQCAGESSPWAASRLIACRDGRVRRIPIEPALFPLADGLPNRVGTLRGAGNSIVSQVAATFIIACLETLLA